MENPVRFSPELERQLAQIAIGSNPAEIDHLREAIHEEIEDMVDYYLAGQIMGRIRSGEDKTIPLEEVRKELGLED